MLLMLFINFLFVETVVEGDEDRFKGRWMMFHDPAGPLIIIVFRWVDFIGGEGDFEEGSTPRTGFIILDADAFGDEDGVSGHKSLPGPGRGDVR